MQAQRHLKSSDTCISVHLKLSHTQLKVIKQMIREITESNSVPALNKKEKEREERGERREGGRKGRERGGRERERKFPSYRTEVQYAKKIISKSSSEAIRVAFAMQV